MNGKTVVITGATSGIGEAAALALAAQGARIVFTARDEARARALMGHLTRANPDAAHDFALADLSTLAGMRAAGEALSSKASHIDVLVNNAGAIFERREETQDGLEKTFALNHMAYFVITESLRPNLDPERGRIVSTASGAHTMARPDFDDLQMSRSFSSMTAYGNSKLFNILWTHELARRLKGSRITANCFHPGGVATGFGANNNGWLKMVFKLASPLLLSPEKGADTLVWLASSTDVAGKSGGYYVRRRLTLPAAAARDETSGHRLWAESEKIAVQTEPAVP